MPSTRAEDGDMSPGSKEKARELEPIIWDTWPEKYSTVRWKLLASVRDNILYIYVGLVVVRCVLIVYNSDLRRAFLTDTEAFFVNR